jgi:DDE superfamily endonuclease
VRDNRHDSADLFGTICPARGVRAAITMPAVNTEAMNEHIMEMSSQVSPTAHAMLLLDTAGWHQTGQRLRLLDNITLPPLPPYSPELNPMRTSGNTGEPTSSAIWSGTVARLSWMPAKRHGNSSPEIQTQSVQLEDANGHVSAVRAVDITF